MIKETEKKLKWDLAQFKKNNTLRMVNILEGSVRKV